MGCAPRRAPTSCTSNIIDKKKHCVLVVKEDGTPIRVFGKKGKKSGELYTPCGIALSEGRLYITDRADRVQVFETNGTYITTYGSGEGSGPSNFDTPRGLTVVGSIVYVADFYNGRIQRLDKKTGEFLSPIGSWGKGKG